MSAESGVACAMRGLSAECRCPRGAKYRYPLHSADNPGELPVGPGPSVRTSARSGPLGATASWLVAKEQEARGASDRGASGLGAPLGPAPRPDQQHHPVASYRDHTAAHAKAGPEQDLCSGPACRAGGHRLSARARSARAPVNRRVPPTHDMRPSMAPAGAQRVAMEPSAWR